MNKFNAVSLISKINWSEIETDQINDFIKSTVNNNLEIDFFEYCNKWKLAPWVYTQLYRNNLLHQFTIETKDKFEDTHIKIKIENEKRNKEAIRFLNEFKKQDIDVVILKGNLFAHTVYKDTGYKKMNDFDIFIHEEDWDKIQDIYFSLGYIPLGFGWSGEKQKAAKFSHVGMSFISPDFSCIIGSQWGLKSPTTNYCVNIEDAWENTKEFDFIGIKVKQLSPEYNLLHLILHMGIFKCGVRDCMDVYNYLLYETIDKTKFYDLIKQVNAIDKSYFTLTLSNICAGTLDQLINGINPNNNSFITHRLKKRLEVQYLSKDFQTSYNDYFQDIEKTVIYFNIFPNFHKKIIFYFIILKNIFFPNREVALKLSDKFGNSSLLNLIKARLKAPYYVFSLIAQEIGWKFTFLLFLKLFLDLIFSIKNYIVKKESYFDYLKKRGINPKEIEQAVKNIQ